VCALVDLDVQLVARRLVERAAPVGADLGAHTQVAQERKRAAGGSRRAEIEMDGDAPAPEVPGTGGVEERRDLGEPATAAERRDLRQLVPEVVGERHYMSTPSRVSSRRL
jgi:hypothetical protein